MVAAQAESVARLYREALSLPSDDRLALASRILESLVAEKSRPADPPSALNLIGLWKEGSHLTDEDVERIRDEYLMDKYGIRDANSP